MLLELDVDQVVELALVAVAFAGDRDGGNAAPLRAAQTADTFLGADHQRDGGRDLASLDVLEEVLEAGTFAGEQRSQPKHSPQLKQRVTSSRASMSADADA